MDKLSKKEAVRGIVGEHDMGKGPILTLDMPRPPGKADQYQ